MGNEFQYFIEMAKCGSVSTKVFFMRRASLEKQATQMDKEKQPEYTT